jgi:Family of unknown function (DUF5990)
MTGSPGRSRRVVGGDAAVPKYGAGTFLRPEPVVRAGRSAPNVHLLDMNPLVTKPQHGTGSHRHAIGENDGQGARMGNAELRIIGRRLPGITWSGRERIHVGVQRGSEVIDLVPGDAADAIFNVELEVVGDPEGEPDFRGPYVNGKRGERFVYLSWAEVDKEGAPTIFRRLKLHLAPLLEQFSAESVLAAKRIQAVLELTDTKGRPLAASVRPPWVTWRLGASRASA